MVSEKPKRTILGSIAQDHEVEVVISLDSDANESVVTPSLIAQLRQKGGWLTFQDLAKPIKIQSIYQQKSKIHQVVKLNFNLPTDAGYLLLRNFACWTVEKDLPIGLGQDLLGKEVL